MATMITSECINCGACEPECPNNAISQAEEIYIIDPLLCTECVGFHDYEACAAVCPVDCCVTDPNNVETEEVLIARARAIHQDVEFGETFESRFGSGEKKAAEPAKAAARTETPAAVPAKPAKPVVAPEPPAPTPAEPAKTVAQPKPSSPAPVAEPKPSPAATTVAQRAPAVAQPAKPSDGERLPVAIEIPDPDQWEIPIRCYKCNEKYTAPAKHFIIGNVLFCPNCYRSMVIKDTLNYEIRTTIKEFHANWEKDLADFQAKREEERRALQEKREKGLQAFEMKRKKTVESFKNHLESITESYDAPGKPAKKRSLLGWG
jgi:Fe-S-cluster-containing hydrogenase component 2